MKVVFEEHRNNGIFLSGNGYAQSRYVYTPIAKSHTEVGIRYNWAPVITKNIIRLLCAK